MTTQTKSSKFIEYMKIHLISLNQDKFKLFDKMLEIDSPSDEYTKLDYDYNFIVGQITATEHLLSVATDIMNDNLQGKGY